jgi:hypothetical protein
MIKKVLAKRALRDPDAARADLAYWLSRPPEERVAAVDELRRQRHGGYLTLKKVIRVVQRRRG